MRPAGLAEPPAPHSGDRVREDHELVEVTAGQRGGEPVDPVVAAHYGVDPAVPAGTRFPGHGVYRGQGRAVQREPLNSARLGVGIELLSDLDPRLTVLGGERLETQQQRARADRDTHAVRARGPDL